MRRIKELVSKLFNFISCLLMSKGDYIILNAWIDLKFGKIKKRNFGDELNYYLLKELTGKHIAGYYNICHIRKHPDLMFIGSLVEEFVTPNSIIWGSGAISGEKPLRHKPAKVCAVRGKLTRQYLLKQGAECPAVYGDPALLLPYLYQPKVEKKYKIGIIPHHSDLGSPILDNLLKKARCNVHIINFVEYKEWHEVVDEICECESIISSSLHGLIISDAYNIPNLWIKLSDKLIGGDFKFLDYFSGVGRKTEYPYKISEKSDFSSISQLLTTWEPIIFDIQKFISVGPVQIQLKYDTKYHNTSI